MGKREVRKALGTSEPREALKPVRQASAETDAMFEALRGKVAATEAALVPASAVDLDRIVRRGQRGRGGQAIIRGCDADGWLLAVR